MKADEFVTEYKKNRKAPKFNIKPRTGHAPTQTGAGEHRDKKKEQKQGYEKHKSKVAEGVRDLGYDAQSLIMKLRRDIEEKRLPPTREAILAAANELAGDMDFAPELLVRQVLGQSVEERVRDPEDWDEGNTEPPNNFAIYINGKKWKVFKGRGQYADDAREMAHYRQLKDWCAKKSASTGKKWEVYITGEPATE